MKDKEFEVPVWINFESVHMKKMYFGFAQGEAVNESNLIAIKYHLHNNLRPVNFIICTAHLILLN